VSLPRDFEFATAIWSVEYRIRAKRSEIDHRGEAHNLLTHQKMINIPRSSGRRRDLQSSDHVLCRADDMHRVMLDHDSGSPLHIFF
jgi:hypothetical protein